MVAIPCICPPNAAGETRHPDGDTVELRWPLSFVDGRTARNIIVMGKSEDQSTAEIMAALTEWYLIAGIRSWTVTDAKGKAVEPNRVTIREYLMANIDAASLVGDAADELYSEAVIAPLAVRGSASSPGTPTNGSTYQTNGSSSKPRKRSKPSSITTIPTAATGTISPSPDGGSSSSPKSA